MARIPFRDVYVLSARREPNQAALNDPPVPDTHIVSRVEAHVRTH